jgi:hypothetical protein
MQPANLDRSRGQFAVRRRSGNQRLAPPRRSNRSILGPPWQLTIDHSAVAIRCEGATDVQVCTILNGSNYPHPIGQQQYLQSYQRGKEEAVLQREAHQLRLLPYGDSRGRGCHRDGLQADHFA